MVTDFMADCSSWAEISFAYQNVEKYEFEAGSLNISNHDKRLVSLYL